MSKIKIRNFGPIKKGFLENDGWMDINRVTVFIGNQGSGKSTVAKLISTLTWLEKAMVKGLLRQDEYTNHTKFLKHFSYQRLVSYFQDDTEIEYRGNAFIFKYSSGVFTVNKAVENGYILPKIMYVPAERNFLSVVDRPDKIKDLPATLYTFNDEYDGAKIKFASGINLPINNVRFVYDSLNKLAHIEGENHSYKLRLSEASSGFQSSVPLFLVSKYLSEKLHAEEDSSLKENSLQEQRQLEKEIKAILEDSQLTPEIRQVSLRQLSGKRKPACFINIVEEPELNLFPKSQREILYRLTEYANADAGNKLIITTHSPYLINYLTLAVKAHRVNEHLSKKGAIDDLAKIVPVQSAVNPNDLIIYQLDESSGIISRLEDYKGLPSDENFLNDSLGETNELFAQLQQIEKGWL